MSRRTSFSPRGWITPILVLATVVGVGVGLVVWKQADLEAAQVASANQPEPVEAVRVAEAVPFEHRRSTTSIGTVLALRSVTLRNELAGTVRSVALSPGGVVAAGKVLVALDVSVEEAELQAQEAQAALAETMLGRMERLVQDRAVSETDVDRARAERDVALAQIARTRAVIERKTIRAPFASRVGVADVHPGQYLEAGTTLTTLQGVEAAVHVDFAVTQQVAAGLRGGDRVEVFAQNETAPVVARLIAIDARIDPSTRNALVRARIENGRAFAPGASVRVRVHVGTPSMAVAVPASAVRKGPAGDHVFVLEIDEQGNTRARMRPVDVLALLGDRVVIESGLVAGDRVAASGSFKLRESALVVVAGEPGTAEESR